MYTYSEKRRQRDEAQKNAARRDEIERLLAQGLKASEVARRLGISRQRVHQIRTGYQSYAFFLAHHRRKIDYGCCTNCESKAVVIHHKNGNSRDNRSQNLMPLCYPCHVEIHRGLPRIKQPWSVKTDEMILRLRGIGLSQSEIGRALGYSRATICLRLQKITPPDSRTKSR